MRQSLLVPVLLAIALSVGEAQTTETPAPFDSAGRILNVNGTLARRLGLLPPAWPVSGEFVEARLFQSGDGGHVIVVQRTSGANDRYPLTAIETVALRATFAAATSRVGRVVAEDPASMVAEPARGPFIRNQMLMTGVLYGPALAALTHDPSVGSGAYLLAVGGSFFALTKIAHDTPISRAQNSMASDGSLRGWALTAASLNAVGANLDADGTAVSILVGGIGGSVIGFQRARTLTNSEAQAAMTGSTLAAVAAMGTAALTGLSGDADSVRQRKSSAALVAGGIAGYLLGPRYPRQAGYTVTAGDISLVRLGAILGLLTAITPIATDSTINNHVAAGIATAGWVGGALIADRIAVRPFNHSESEARMVNIGAIGGGLMGLALPIMARSDNDTFITGAATAGAIAGAIVAQRMIAPPRQGAPYLGPGNSGEGRQPHLTFNPEGLIMTAARQRGNHSLFQLTF